MKKAFEDDGKWEPMEVFCIDCGAPVTISGFVVGVLNTGIQLCHQRGWEPLSKREVTRCSQCRRKYEATEPLGRQENAAQLAHARRAARALRRIDDEGFDGPVD